MPTFKEWVEKKAEESQRSGRELRLNEWREAYRHLTDQIQAWLDEAGGGRITVFRYPIERAEQGLGPYQFDALKIYVGDSSVDVLPVGRNVVGHISSRGLVGPRAAGRVDITDGVTKFALYRSQEGGQDSWYVVDERGEVTPLSPNRLQEILMDMMS